MSSQSSQSVTELFGNGFPYPEEVPSAQDFEEIVQQKRSKFCKDRNASIREKARTIVDVEDHATAIRFSRKRTPYWFVTINPKPDVTVELLHNTIVSVLQQEQISDPVWSYEIRQAPAEGLHAHVLFTCEVLDDNFCKRKIKAPFVPQICGTLKHVHVKWVIESELEAVKSYIRKGYTSKSKTKSNEATLAWRAEAGIPAEMTEDHLLVWSSMPHNNLISLN